MNKDAEAEIERLVDLYENLTDRTVDPRPIRAAMAWAFDYAAQHCDAQKVVWAGQQVDPGHVLDMTAKNLRGLAKA